MIDKLADRLGMDEQTLISHIRAAVGDDPQMVWVRQTLRIEDGGIIVHKPTGFGVILATGPETAFSFMTEHEQRDDHHSRVSSVRIGFA